LANEIINNSSREIDCSIVQKKNYKIHKKSNLYENTEETEGNEKESLRN
jgi:predicted house-cleaning noncanonical NTP pyrophosphatase (MazG superfamily)